MTEYSVSFALDLQRLNTIREILMNQYSAMLVVKFNIRR
ncbi:hypothetical protein [Caudoviricetes sp.]|nr:hypothetical protein [Caudoviricetes sp.]